jgi:hypothetical protein
MDERSILIACTFVFALFGWYSANAVKKTQIVRLVDVFVYGPYLAFIALSRDYTLGFFDKMALLFIGVTTVTYNARNYLHSS